MENIFIMFAQHRKNPQYLLELKCKELKLLLNLCFSNVEIIILGNSMDKCNFSDGPQLIFQGM